jgi:rhodanese-related sulfurtransferase
MRMHELHDAGLYRDPGALVLDVRSRAEYRRAHVPGSRNIPVHSIERRPQRWRQALSPYRQIFLHCSSGERAQRAHAALDLPQAVPVRDSGMIDWAKAGYPVEREISLARDLVTGMLAGLAGDAAVALTDKALGALVSDEQKRRERAVREGSPHEVGGKRVGAKLLGHSLSRASERKAQVAFTIGYGIVFGALYALTRRRIPGAKKLLGLPFGIGFFFACDGLLAPRLGMTPGLERIPWQFNTKEMTNHIAWTAAAELVHRAAERSR